MFLEDSASLGVLEHEAVAFEAFLHSDFFHVPAEARVDIVDGFLAVLGKETLYILSCCSFDVFLFERRASPRSYAWVASEKGLNPVLPERLMIAASSENLRGKVTKLPVRGRQP
jgi:hypothetical protein